VRGDGRAAQTGGVSNATAARELPVSEAVVDRQSIHDELERARATFHALVSQASPAQLRLGSEGTRWTNQQLLFHMLFGYLVVRRLLRLVRMFGRLPGGYSRAFAGVLNSGRRPFHLVNYLGSCGGALVFRGPRLIAMFDRTVAALHRSLDRESELTLRGVMHFPVDWDPFFQHRMRLIDVYHYGTQHFDYHQDQLTLGRPES
jgi:hypothetical protein